MDSPSGSQLKILLHPGDDYVASLEPESLQVLVSELAPAIAHLIIFYAACLNLDLSPTADLP